MAATRYRTVPPSGHIDTGVLLPLYTCTVAGPASTRANAEVALESARIPLLPDDHHDAGWGRLLPDVESWLTCQCPDPSAVAAALPEGWAVRMHHHATDAPKPDPVTASIADMRAEIEALRARVDAGEGRRG